MNMNPTVSRTPRTMKANVPIVTRCDAFPEIPASARLAIAIPTARWTPMARSVIASMVGVANEEVVVLVADNSENAEKRKFLRGLRSLNPNLIAVCHKKNIGGKDNALYLLNWCKNVEFFAIMADDDWMSPTYHTDAYQTLLTNPLATCAETGTALVDIGDGRLVKVSQPTMSGTTMLERLTQWNGIAARVTMYNVSRRSALQGALDYLRDTPLPGLTMGEDLWELNRLAMGDFVSTPGHGCLIHYPEYGSCLGDPTSRYYELLCKDVGLDYQAVFFMGLSTAVQCAIFLMGTMSPIAEPEQRSNCGQFVFAHIFTHSFLPKVASESSQAAAIAIFKNHPEVLDGFLKHCKPPFSESPVFSMEFLDWFIKLIRVFETKPVADEPSLSERFSSFANSLLVAPHR